MGAVVCGKKLGQLAIMTVPFRKKLGDGLCAGGRRLHEKIQGTKAAPVCNAIVRFFAAMGRGCKALNARFKTLGKPLRLGISAASLLLVVGLVLSAALSGGSQKTAQTDLPIEVQWSPSPTPVPETTALPSQEPVVQAAAAKAALLRRNCIPAALAQQIQVAVVVVHQHTALVALMVAPAAPAS